MIVFRTMNPVGSNSPKDLSDNASTFDEVCTSPLPWAENRVGRKILTLVGQQFEIDEAIRGIGYSRIGDYDSGPLTISLPNQVFSKDGEFWIAKPTLELPYTTVENWAIDEAFFNPIGDAMLRQELAAPPGSSLVRFIPSGPGALSRTLQEKIREIIGPGDYSSQAEAESAVVSDPSKFFLNNPTAFTLTVGAGGQFSTILAALEAAVRMRPTYTNGAGMCKVHLLPGFVVREQVLILSGHDLGWIRITSADASVLIDPDYVTTYLSVADDSIPAFGADNGSVLPVLGCQFHYASNLTAKDGVAVMGGSKSALMPSCGIDNCRRGFLIFYKSEGHCYPRGLTQGGDGTGAGTAVGARFRNCRLRGLHVAYGSDAALGRSDFSQSQGDVGVYIIWNSRADLYQSNASYAINGTAFLCRDGSNLNCRESNGSHSKRAFHALHDARINARSRITGPTMIWIGDGAMYCSEYGVLSSGNSHVEASELNASFCTGSAGISASDTSTISFIDGVAQSCTNRGVWSQNGAIISAVRANVSGSKIGLEAFGGPGGISAEDVIAIGCSVAGALAYKGGKIDVSAGNLSGCARGIEPRDGGEISARGANISGCTDRACSAIDGGRANVQEANLQNAGSRAITCRGGDVVATGANCTGAVNWAVEVEDGGIVKFVGGIPGAAPFNVPINTVSSKGIIFHQEP